MRAKRILTAALTSALLVLTACSQGAAPEPRPTLDSTLLPEAAGIGFGNPEAPTAIEVHSDPQCPWCAKFETTVGPQLEELVTSGEIHLTLVLRSFLDQSDPTAGTSRKAANAVLCVQPTGHALEYYSTLMRKQPAAGAKPWDATSLTKMATDLGITDEGVADCIAETRHGELVDQMENKALADGVTGTPRLYLDQREAPQVVMRALIEGELTMEQILAANPKE